MAFPRTNAALPGPSMAIVRCRECAARNRKSLGIGVEPQDYPDTAVVCGMPGCDRPGLVWLRGAEAMEYRDGQRICFPLSGERHLSKVRVKPPAGRTGLSIATPRSFGGSAALAGTGVGSDVPSTGPG